MTLTDYDEAAIGRVRESLLKHPDTHFYLFYSSDATPPPIDNWRCVLRESRFVENGRFMLVPQDEFHAQLDSLKRGS